MTTILPKEPVVTDRESVILSNAERRNLRRKFQASVALARDAVNPKIQMKRFVAVKKAEAVSIADDVAQLAKQNKSILGIAGVGALLFISRGPIINFIHRLRNRNNAPDGE